MSAYTIIQKRRSIRRFKQRAVSYKTLIRLVNAARLAPSAANLQPWEFIIVNKKPLVDKIFSHLKWAGYLGDKGAPEEGRRPSVYIVVLINKHKCKFPKYAQADLGAAIENMLLAATEIGVGSCWLGAIDRKAIAKILSLPRNVAVEYVVALGYPDEKSKIEPMKKNCKYYKDKKNIMHVPKRRFLDILHRN
ncbi:MAG: nitroreductase family protein [Candidatus Omnitrophica bacterium]|nr:nitroreductase family protein [Candidatus Omnitrophota bacterium]